MTTTTIRIDDRALWRDGDILTGESDRGTFTTTLHTTGGDLPSLVDTLGFVVRRNNGKLGAHYIDPRLTLYVTREVPALPDEPNTILLDVETRDGRAWPLVRVTGSGGMLAYDTDGLEDASLNPAHIVAWTPAVPGERVTR